MADAATFGPGSLFGVPLSSFPPGVPWKDTREMLLDIFSDMQHPWVQEYLFRKDCLVDAQILSDPMRSINSLPLMFSTTSDKRLSGGFEGTAVYMRHNVPGFVIGEIGAGVAIESSFGTGGAEVVFPLANLFVRYINNLKSGAQLNVSFNERVGTVEVTHLKHNEDGLWTSVLLWFVPQLFLKSFDIRIGAINFDILQNALVKSIVSVVKHPRRLAIANGNYSFQVADNNGDHFFKSVFSSYANGNAMMSMPVFADGRWTFEIPQEALMRMKKWAIGDRLGRLEITPQNTMPLSIDSDDSSGMEEFAQESNRPNTLVYGQIVDTSSAVVSGAVGDDEDEDFVPIAPAPLQVPEPAPTAQELKEQERLERAERRKIKKREAAARCNERKTAERKRLALLKEKEKQANG